MITKIDMTILTVEALRDEQPMPTPKVPTTLHGRDSWYPYYAGYSSDFVRFVIESSELRPGSVVLDPWNGAGTTTQIAAELGFRTVGIDLNPVMVVVARARRLRNQDVAKLRELAKQMTGRSGRKSSVPASDGLSLWFDSATAADIRAIVRRIRAVSPSDPWRSAMHPEVASACFFWTGLFRCVRSLMAPLRGTNPTWLRRPSEEARISVPRGAVAALFSEEVNSMLLALDEERPSEQDRGSCEILAGSSTALPVDDESIQMVVASPPYCTRIDYAVTTSVELATLGLGSDEALRAVREQTIGTTTIRATQPPIKQAWGPTCLALLDAIKSHESRASETYYLKTHQQYFNDIHLSLKELHRCLAQDAEAVLVVQDSYYKNVHNDVPAIVAEMCNGFGWSLEKRLAFPVTRNLAGINGRAKKYLDGRAAVEVVLRFRKG